MPSPISPTLALSPHAVNIHADFGANLSIHGASLSTDGFAT
jgi:hypothetical protein